MRNWTASTSSLLMPEERTSTNIFNMDETPMKFDMPGNRTLHPGGAKTVLIRTNGAEKRGFTAILTIAADGR